MNQLRVARGLPRLGLVAPDLYANRHTFRDITVGDNGVGTSTGTAATVGWDAATGLGVPTGLTAGALSGAGPRRKVLDHKSWKPEVDSKLETEIVRPGDPPEWMRLLPVMARGLDELAQEVRELRAFIRAEERPPVGDDVITRSAAERSELG